MPFKKGHKGFSKKRTSLGPQTPSNREDGDDEDMLDADGEGDDLNDMTIYGDGEEGDDTAGTPAQGEDGDEDGTPTVTAIPGRKSRGGGRGRGGRKSAGGSLRTPEPGDDESESGTPYRNRRGRGRGGAAASRTARRRTQLPESNHVLVDGVKIEVVNDDALLDFDEEGETKVDELGNLQGDREYRVRTFKVIDRGERLYMLSTEPARCCGFRDSYLFFNKHPKLFKVLLGDAEKKDLIDRDILPNSYKGRNIGVVTARSVFREFGAKIIVAGKKVTDDYKVAEARANGDVEGELADPNDNMPNGGQSYNRNRYVAWFGASDVYKIQAAGPASHGAGKPGVPGGGKRRTNITLGNWQYMHAREASRFNTAALARRRTTHAGVYDTHTNLMFMPAIMQPTHARWEQIPPPSDSTSQPLLTNGNSTHSPPPKSSPEEPTLFPSIPRPISHTFAIVDTTYIAPPISSFATSYRPDLESGTSPASIPAELIAELPEDCRQALLAVREQENRWHDQWGTEATSCMRGQLKVGFAGYPV